MRWNERFRGALEYIVSSVLRAKTLLEKTHPEQFEPLETLAGHDGDELHFAEKSDFRGRQARSMRESHA